MPEVQSDMKLAIAIGCIVLATSSSSCSRLALRGDAKDCGFSASFAIPDQGKNAWITFSRVRAETVDGKTTCGSSYGTTRVDKALVDGTQLDSIPIGEEVVYVAPMGFDPETQAITIEVDGRSYSTDQNDVRRTGNGYSIGMRPFPPK